MQPELIDKPKQVIIIRQKFPNPENGGMRKLRTGKYVAQGCHASQLAFVRAMGDAMGRRGNPRNWQAYYGWMTGNFAKVCVYVETEEELLALAAKAEEVGLPFGLIKDTGLTEFGGVPTHTALGIGPAFDSDLKPITGHLPLF